MTRRLPPIAGEWINREKRLDFSFEGRPVSGFEGDSISAALMANGEVVLGRSFKYHRPRSVMSAANHDVNVLVQTADRTNIRADVERVESGMVLKPVNVFGSLRRDRASLLQKVKRFLPVGFYYKAFYRPKCIFPFWEKRIRAIAGLGRVDTGWRSERPLATCHHTDVLVVGGGASGMSAALSAAEAGARVVLADENPQLGGSLHYQSFSDDGRQRTLKKLIAAVEAEPGITILTRAEACGYYGHHLVPLVTEEGITKVQAKAVVVATGVFEQPAVFGNNDVPGVMLASGAQRLIARYAVKPCQRAVILTANEEGYHAALDMLSVGLEVAAVVDLAASAGRGDVAAAIKNKGIPVFDHAAIYETVTANPGVSAVEICPLDKDGNLDRSKRTLISADGVLTSVGFAPAAALLYQAGVKFSYDPVLHQLVPGDQPKGLYAVGRVNGVYDLSDKQVDGKACGKLAAADALGQTVGQPKRPGRSQTAHSHEYPVFEHAKGWNFVDMDEDLTLKDLTRAAEEGFDNIELMKRFSTIGMGPSQGKHSNMNGIRILARKRNHSIDETGSTTARPMFHPVPIKALAGQRLRPMRRTVLHEFHVSHGAQFMEAGHWLRPAFYGAEADRETAISAEVAAVRSRAGLIDISTLGKIEIFGVDAAELMDRLYTMRMSNIKEGMTRYALMVDEAGIIIDDGVAARLSQNRFYVTTTSGTSDSSFAEMQKRILEWGLDVDILNLTGQLGAINIAGPLSRQVLGPLTDIDLSEEAFPFLAVRQGLVFGEPALLMRAAFVGELSYEIHMAPAALEKAVAAIMDTGESVSIRPFGVEAQRLLRLEKGHIIVGQDTDGLTNPFEAGISWAVHAEKNYFVGKRTLECLKPKRARSLVGFTADIDEAALKMAECHLVIVDGDIRGRVTSVARSRNVDKVIGLAYVDDGTVRSDGSFEIRISDGRMVTVRSADLPFYDPDGSRQRLDVDSPAKVTVPGEAA
jgi:sarcosine oxidase subunit alpha